MGEDDLQGRSRRYRPIGRRRVLRGTGGALVAAAGVAGVSGGAAAADGDYETTDQRIESFDGTELATSLYEPTDDGPFPVIMMTHGWGGNRSMSAGSAERYADDGYAVLTWDSRGFGDSGGDVGLNGPNEVRDVSALIDWLDDEGITESTPRIGMDGLSYAGGIQLVAAVEEDRIDAIVPRMTWNDLRYSLAPNDVIKSGWQTFLLGSGAASTYEFGDGPTMDGRIFDWYEEALETNEIPQESLEANEKRSVAGREDQVDAATLVIAGWNDALFKPNEALWNYRNIADDGTDTALAFYEGGHAVEEATARLNEDIIGRLDDLAHDWLDKYVRGADRDIPEVSLYQPQREEWETHETFPPADVSDRTFELAEGTDRSESYLHRDRWFTPESRTFSWQFDEKTEICGSPTLDLHLDVHGPEAILFFELRHDDRWWTTSHINNLGETTRVHESGVQQVTVEHSPLQWVFEAGDRLEFYVGTSSPVYLDSRDSDGVTILHDGEHQSSVTVPTRDAQPNDSASWFDLFAGQ